MYSFRTTPFRGRDRSASREEPVRRALKALDDAGVIEPAGKGRSRTKGQKGKPATWRYIADDLDETPDEEPF